jgi:hypothetical protein
MKGDSTELRIDTTDPVSCPEAATPVKKTIPTGKDLSLFGMILAAVWVGGFSAWKFLSQGMATVPLQDIILSGLTVGGCFAPVIVSIWMDKFIQLRRP